MFGHRIEIPSTGLSRASFIKALINLRGEVIVENWEGHSEGDPGVLTLAFSRIRERDQICENFNLKPGESAEIKLPIQRDVPDDYSTPEPLAKWVVEHFKPSGRILDPCCGEGIFLKLMPGADWCEKNKGRDFFAYKQHVDWIIANPPYNLRLEFLQKSIELAEDIVFVIQVPTMFFKSKLDMLKEGSFGIREIVLIDHPPAPWPQFQTQLGVVHMKKHYNGGVRMTDIRGKVAVDFGSDSPPDTPDESPEA
ncbi:MAG: hypothetical protein OEY85_00150 [Rhodospirillales bacterium]|nr:hypothetical protein [Rhodospirillales bacterium]